MITIVQVCDSNHCQRRIMSDILFFDVSMVIIKCNLWVTTSSIFHWWLTEKLKYSMSGRSWGEFKFCVCVPYFLIIKEISKSCSVSHRVKTPLHWFPGFEKAVHVSRHYHSISFILRPSPTRHTSLTTCPRTPGGGACFTACVHNEECCIWTFLKI